MRRTRGVLTESHPVLRSVLWCLFDQRSFCRALLASELVTTGESKTLSLIVVRGASNFAGKPGLAESIGNADWFSMKLLFRYSSGRQNGKPQQQNLNRCGNIAQPGVCFGVPERQVLVEQREKSWSQLCSARCADRQQLLAIGLTEGCFTWNHRLAVVASLQ